MDDENTNRPVDDAVHPGSDATNPTTNEPQVPANDQPPVPTEPAGDTAPNPGIGNDGAGEAPDVQDPGTGSDAGPTPAV